MRRGFRVEDDFGAYNPPLTLLVIVGACVLSLIVSRVFTWAASKSPFWNMGFAVAVVITAAALLVLGVILIIRRIMPSVN
jgi:hypothetical protein